MGSRAARRRAPVGPPRPGRAPGRVLRGTIRPAGGPSPCQRLARRETRPDTVVTAEPAWSSSLAARADGSRRSAATARRCTSSRASGSAMASSSQGLQPGEEKTHILSVLSSSRLAAGALGGPAAYLLGFFRALRCAGGVAGSRACPAVFAALPAAWRSDHYAGGADYCTGASAVRPGPDRSGLPALPGPPRPWPPGQHIAIRRTRARASVPVDPVLPGPRRKPALLQARRRSSRPRAGSACPDTDAADLADMCSARR